MALISFPDVPDVPGVPSVLRNISSSAVAKVAALVPGGSKLLTGYLIFRQSQWGVFDSTNTNTLLNPDSFVAMEYGNSVNLPSYPLEPNSFQNYNNVQTPGSLRLAMAVDSGQSARSQFCVMLDMLLANLTLCNILTPERVFPSMKLAGYTYRKTASSGVSCIVFDTTWQEIRVAPAATGANTADPTSSADVNDGQVQASDATSVQVNAVQTSSDTTVRTLQ